MELYRKKDLDIISKNINDLEDKFQREFQQKHMIPTLDEIDKVNEIIKNYIRENGMIVYGGYAQNELIKSKNKDDVFYKDIDLADIEFYSPEPIKSMIELCDILHKMGYEHVVGEEGVHPETYKVFVNFHPYTDISYMAPTLFKKCPVMIIDGLKMTHPHFMYTDALRVYADPLTSNFRLSKTFFRFTKLIKYYPFDENMEYNKIEFGYFLKDVDEYIRKEILHKMKLILIGFHSFNRLMEKAEMKKTYFVETPFYQMISVDFKNDRDKIYKLLQQKLGKDVRYKKYYPFFQFLGDSVEFYYKDKLILRLYDRNDRCIVYKYSEKKKTYYGTFQLQLLYNLIMYNLAIIRDNKFNQTLYMTMFVRLLKARDIFLEKNNLSVLDESPFEEFTMKCMGDPVDSIRQSRLNISKNVKKGKAAKFRYRPSGGEGKVPDYRFMDSSGQLRD
jgi:hypothetical protein